jgi:fatty acid desaturase
MHKTSRISANTEPLKPALQVTAEETTGNGALSERSPVTLPDTAVIAGGLVALGAMLGPEWGTYLGLALAVPAILIVLMKVWLHLMEIAQKEHKAGPWG